MEQRFEALVNLGSTAGRYDLHVGHRMQLRFQGPGNIGSAASCFME
jgi:hypothetical protein